MTMQILGGNQYKAERIAREMVKKFTVKDLDWIIEEGVNIKEHHRLCSAVSDDFTKEERRRLILEQYLGDKLTGKLHKAFEDYVELRLNELCAHSSAHFHLGYATALRLLGVNTFPKARKRR